MNSTIQNLPQLSAISVHSWQSKMFIAIAKKDINKYYSNRKCSSDFLLIQTWLSELVFCSTIICSLRYSAIFL